MSGHLSTWSTGLSPPIGWSGAYEWGYVAAYHAHLKEHRGEFPSPDDPAHWVAGTMIAGDSTCVRPFELGLEEDYTELAKKEKTSRSSIKRCC